jgi:hypothetical protein
MDRGSFSLNALDTCNMEYNLQDVGRHLDVPETAATRPQCPELSSGYHLLHNNDTWRTEYYVSECLPDISETWSSLPSPPHTVASSTEPCTLGSLVPDSRDGLATAAEVSQGPRLCIPDAQSPYESLAEGYIALLYLE